MGEQRVLLIIGGGIAAYKSLELIRLLRKREILVRCILTRGGAEFVTPLSVAGLSGDKVYTELFDLTDEAEMGHIELSRDADLLVVAPATANLMARMAAGLADDLASTALLATDKPVLCAPAMNVRMWEHPATQRNIETLGGDGIHFVGPDEGAMACGEYGPGRLAEPEVIADTIVDLLARPRLPGGSAFSGGSSLRDRSLADGALKGLHVLVTSGPTHEPIDPVRYLANRSSGKQGHAIAAEAARAGAKVTLVSGPVQVPDPSGVNTVHVETADQMKAAVDAALPADVAICAAAVADWRPENEGREKIKKAPGKGPPSLGLVENPDILHGLAQRSERRPGLVIGFAAETQDVVAHATAKRARKGADWILANDVSPESGVMGGDMNTIHMITDSDHEEWPRMSKDQVAQTLIERISKAVAAR